MNQEDVQHFKDAAKEATKRNAGLEPKRSTYYASWPVPKTGGLVRYVHGPESDPVLYYKGPCKDCGAEFVITRRPVKSKVDGNGRWPSYCRSCSEDRKAADNAAARTRMAKLRAERNKLRDDNYRKLRRPVPEAGKRGRPKGSRNFG